MPSKEPPFNPKPPGPAGPTPELEKIQRWRWILNQNVPVIGGWVHRRVLTGLTEAARTGNAMAVQSLSMALAHHSEAEVRKAAAQALCKVNFTSGIDMMWSVWVETRNATLESLLLEGKHLASNPASVRLLSALRLNDMETVTRGSSELIPALIAATGDHNPLIAERAAHGLRSLRNPSSVDAVCRIWQETRSPLLAEVLQATGYVAQKPAHIRVLAALKNNQLPVVLHASAEMVAPLVAATDDPDPQIAERARTCLLNLQSQPAVDAFCRLWSEARSPLLEAALLTAGYQAHSPLEVRLLVALKTSRLTTAQEAPPEGLPVLLAATRDVDPLIAANALSALHALQRVETRDALCLRFIHEGEPLACQVAVESGYAPNEPEQRALFYFLSEQWPAYDAIDFDQSLMRTLYETGATELRQRIAGRVQVAGKTPYLTILAGFDYRSRADTVNPAEADLLVRILIENAEWERLWRLAPELALPFSLQIIQALAQAGWQPSDEIDQQALAELKVLASQPMLLAGPQLSRALPLALPRANLKISGRVNDVAFSPVAPLLAIASSQRKVVVWNFQTAKVERVIETAFTHSVGKVAYTPRGTLLCAERSNGQAICTIFVFQGQESYHLCSHEGSVTALKPVGENRLLTTGRDQKVTLWDLDTRRQVTEKEFPFWSRAADVSPDGQYAALLHERVSLVRLPEMTIVPGQPYIAPRPNGYKKGTGQNLAFSPDGKYILTGQHNGQVALYFHNSLTTRPRKKTLTEHNQPVRGVYFLPEHPVVVTAGAEGQVRFFRWPEMNALGTLHSPGGTLTSLHIARGGDFMATGANDASLRLWDLRTLDIPALFAQPLATASHNQIATILALGEYETLPQPVRNGLQFMRLLLQYRFRFDILVEEAATIQFGEFDILLGDEK